MENEILDSLEDLGYTGPLVDETILQKAIDDGPKSLEYTALVSWLTIELRVFCKLDEMVNATKSADDSASFVLELTSFLNEIGCPHQSLMSGELNDRLTTRESRSLLLSYLSSELQAVRMTHVNNGDSSRVKVEMNESSTAFDLKNILLTLGFGKPPNTITSEQLFGKTEKKLKEVIGSDSNLLIGKPLFSGTLTAKQWVALSKLQDQMHEEYQLRREVLLKRLDITIQSFKWGDSAKTKIDEIAKVYTPKRQILKPEPKVHLADVLAAREDLAIEEKTSSASVRKNTKSKINGIIIGQVPDRGGRPEEQMPPPPEMPSWQKRTEPPGGGRGGGRGGGGGFSNQGRGGGYDKGPYDSQGSYGNQSDYSNQGYSHDAGYQRGHNRGRGGANRGRGGYQQSGYELAAAYGGFQPQQQYFQRTN